MLYAKIVLVLVCLATVCAASAKSLPTEKDAGRWWPKAVEQATSGHAELRAALLRVPPAQRGGLAFLILNMPTQDRQTLSAKFLLDNTALAYDAWNKAPWKKRVPKALFLNDILPYACLNEARDDPRSLLRAKCLPLIADCRTPGEAAQRLNQKLFPLLNVRYSTERKRPDQSPLESIESGKATCSGLSILLVDACRSVGIPARVVGTPMWTNLRGNHTWVEVWDGRAWRFTGAAEPDPQGLDRGWFAHDASLARKNEPQFAIYASSFQTTGLAFPLVWAPEIDWVHAVNVTDRYAPNAATAATDNMRLLVEVRDASGKRLAANVTVQGIGSQTAPQEGRSKGETADTNDLLAFPVPHGRQGEITATQGGRTVRQAFTAGLEASQVVEVNLGAAPISAATKEHLKQALTAYFVAPVDQQARWTFPANLERLLRENEPAVRQAAWEAYRATPIHAAAKSDFAAHQVQFEKNLSPYTVKTVGTRPAKGWPLFIAMHGGGGAPKELNDSQWVIMQRYYKDHPELGGYRYVALRAPNDTWNGFYDVYVYPLIANLVKQFLTLDDIDPNKVFLMGYSHGGYGAFAIGPKMPDLFAAIHASAAAPTDGETTAKTLRNTVFSCMVGDQDTMYGRLDRCRQFDADVRNLRGDRTDIYPVTVDVKVGYQHSNLPDRDEIVDMYSAVRNPVPRELTWLMTDDVVRDFFWLHTEAPGKTREIDATCRDNEIVVTTTSASSTTILLDSRLIDFAKPVTLDINGQKSQQRVSPRLRTLCETLQRRGDPDLAFTAQIDLPL